MNIVKKFKRGETIPISIPNPALQAESWTLKRVIVYRGSVNSDNKIIFEPDQTTANQETTAYLALIPSDITAVMTVGEWHIETVCTNGKLIDITESKEYFLLSESAENRTRETQTTFDTMQFVPIQNPISGEVTILDLATVNAEVGVIGNVIIQEVITDFDYSILAEPYQEGQAYADGTLVTNNKQLYRVEGGALVQVTIADELSLKVDKQEGKQLSSNDYSDYDKAKLATIEEGAQGNVQSNWNETDASADSYIRNKPTIPTVPTAVSAFDNDAQYLQSSDIAEWAKQPSKPTYTANEVGALPNTTVIPDVPNNVSAFNNDSGYITIADVPARTSQLTNDSDFATSAMLPTKTSDLVNDNGYITSAPTKTSELINDSGFATSSEIPNVPTWAMQSSKPTYTAEEVGAMPSNAVIKASDLVNDVPFATTAEVQSQMANALVKVYQQLTPAEQAQVQSNLGVMPATPSGDPLHNLYVARGATYNPTTDRWTIDIVNDLTTAELAYINIIQPPYIGVTGFNGCFAGKSVRALFPLSVYGGGMALVDNSLLFYYMTSIRTIAVANTRAIAFTGNVSNVFGYCYALQKISKLSIANVSGQQTMFKGCTSLHTIEFYYSGTSSFLQSNLFLQDSPKITVETVLSAINATMPTQTAVILTLHPTAYERAMASEEVQAALATHPKISLASA